MTQHFIVRLALEWFRASGARPLLIMRAVLGAVPHMSALRGETGTRGQDKVQGLRAVRARATEGGMMMLTFTFRSPAGEVVELEAWSRAQAWGTLKAWIGREWRRWIMVGS